MSVTLINNEASVTCEKRVNNSGEAPKGRSTSEPFGGIPFRPTTLLPHSQPEKMYTCLNNGFALSDRLGEPWL